MTTSHIRNQPHFGQGKHRFDRELHWLYCASDAEMGLRSSHGAIVDQLELGVSLEACGIEATPSTGAARLYRRIVAKLWRLPRLHQQVLMLHYTKYPSGVSQIEVAAAHKAWREI